MAGRTQQTAVSRRRKRPAPSVYGGIGTTYEDKDNDYVCPICFEVIEEAHMTKCGHSFCHRCIKQSLDQSNRCPKCNFTIENKEEIFPNFLLNELIEKYRQRQNEQKKIKIEHQNGLPGPGNLVADCEHLDMTNINYLLELLASKKQQLEAECKAAQNQLLKEFLQQVQQRKVEKLEQLNKEIHLIEDDLRCVDEHLVDDRRRSQHVAPEGAVLNGLDPALASSAAAVAATSVGQDGFNGSRNAGRQWLQTTMASRRKKVTQHFEDLEQCYFSSRQRDLLDAADVGSSSSNRNLDDFTESLSKFTRFSSFRTLATLNYASDIYNTSSIVSSIEFDRDCDYFAIAGVTKKIKVFEYGTVIRDQVDMHYPIIEMVCNSKISSIVWSAYHKNMLASADYEGNVTLWDAFNGVKSRVFHEHEKRCWSLDFNKMDPKLLASGSDDSRVKLWYTNMEHSVAFIEAKANVCCVQFNPQNRYHLAFGSADHCVHYYDLRNTKQALNMYKGHRKAVSYAKFLNQSEIVSASTDSQLKLWSLSATSRKADQHQCLRTFKGHTNEKNFVGLATDGDYIACGSENNALYVYYKGLTKQLMTFKFDTVRSVLEKDQKEEESNEFVSAVCWRPKSNVLLAANSHGIIKVLELV